MFSLGQVLAGCLSQTYLTQRQQFLSTAKDTGISCRIRLQALDICPSIILWMFASLIARRASLCSGLEVGFRTIQRICDGGAA